MAKVIPTGAKRLVALSVSVALIVSVVFGVSTDDQATARTSAEVLHEAAAKLEPVARDLWPESFAGLWLSENGLEGGIFVAFTEKAEERVHSLTKEFPEPQLVQPVVFERSMAELETQQQEMIKDQQLAERGELDFGGGQGAEYNLGIDVTRNAAVVYVEDADAVTTAAFKARYGDAVLVRSAPLSVADSCTRVDCRPELRSGLETIDPNESGCSTGFVARAPNGERKLLSAAHCGGTSGDIGDSRRHGGELYGTVRDQKYSGRVDAEMHSIAEAPFVSRPWIYRNPENQTWGVASVGAWAGIMVNDRICKAGITTGESCGRVQDKYFVPFSGAERFIKTSYCARSGDSGAGVYGDPSEGTGHKALGIHHGGSDGPCGQSGDFSVFGAIDYTEGALDVTVVETQ